MSCPDWTVLSSYNLPVIRPPCCEARLHIVMSGEIDQCSHLEFTCVLDKGTPNEKGNQKIPILYLTGNGYCNRQARKLSVNKLLLRRYLQICRWWSHNSTAHIKAISGGISIMKKKRHQLGGAHTWHLDHIVLPYPCDEMFYERYSSEVSVYYTALRTCDQYLHDWCGWEWIPETGNLDISFCKHTVKKLPISKCFFALKSFAKQKCLYWIQ